MQHFTPSVAKVIAACLVIRTRQIGSRALGSATFVDTGQAIGASAGGRSDRAACASSGKRTVLRQMLVDGRPGHRRTRDGPRESGESSQNADDGCAQARQVDLGHARHIDPPRVDDVNRVFVAETLDLSTAETGKGKHAALPRQKREIV